MDTTNNGLVQKKGLSNRLYIKRKDFYWKGQQLAAAQKITEQAGMLLKLSVGEKRVLFLMLSLLLITIYKMKSIIFCDEKLCGRVESLIMRVAVKIRMNCVSAYGQIKDRQQCSQRCRFTNKKSNQHPMRTIIVQVF